MKTSSISPKLVFCSKNIKTLRSVKKRWSDPANHRSQRPSSCHQRSEVGGRLCWRAQEEASSLFPSPQLDKRPRTAVTTAMLIITGKRRPSHLAMGSRQPGVQHSNPLSSKGFPEENSTWCSLGQGFPGRLAPTPELPPLPPTLAAPFKSSPWAPPRQQLRPELQAASHLEGTSRPLQGLWETSSPTSLVIEAGGRCVSACMGLFSRAPGKFPSWTKQNSSLWGEKVSKGSATLNMGGRERHKQKCSSASLPETELNDSNPISCLQDFSDMRGGSPRLGYGFRRPRYFIWPWGSSIMTGPHGTNILQNALWEKLSLNKDKNFSFPYLLTSGLDLWGLL